MEHFTVAIGIGGRGVQTVEALIYLCAVGLGPDELMIVLVDPDESNGNLTKVKTLVESYTHLKEYLKLGPTPHLFKTQIHTAGQIATSPNNILGVNKNLDDFFQYQGLDKMSQDFCRLMYTPGEIKQELSKGFRGHPPIGAAVMAHTDFEVEPWRSMYGRIRGALNQNEIVHVQTFASAYGGTGAAGFPTLSRLLWDKVQADTGIGKKENLRINGCLLLPYFSFLPPVSAEGIFVKSEYFYITTKSALKHYANDKRYYNALYLVGDNRDTEQEFSIGGQDQINKSHYVELLGALSFMDAVRKCQDALAKTQDMKKVCEQVDGIYYASRREPDHIYWSDLPGNGLQPYYRLTYFSVFAAAYTGFYHRLLTHDDFVDNITRVPWYVDYFTQKSIDNLTSNSERELMNVLWRFCDGYIDWMTDMHRKERLNLFNQDHLKERELHGLLYERDTKNIMLDSVKDLPTDLWKRLCDKENRPHEDTTGTGRLVDLLYKAVMSCAKTNYRFQDK